jgi:hypothetical protein
MLDGKLLLRSPGTPRDSCGCARLRPTYATGLLTGAPQIAGRAVGRCAPCALFSHPAPELHAVADHIVAALDARRADPR